MLDEFFAFVSSSDPVYLVGAFTLWILAFSAIGTLVALVLLALFTARNKTYLSPLFLFLLDSLNSPIRTVFRVLGLDETIVDAAYVDMRNKVVEEEYKKTKYKDRLVFMPQCLRSQECPARSTGRGIECVGCGRCVIAVFKKEAEKLGYKGFYVSPGSSLVKRIVFKEKPRAVLGVACLPECKEALQALSKYGVIGQAVPLLKSGCINTVADELGVLSILRAKK